VTTITGGGTGKARGGTGGTITGGRRVGTLRKKWKKGVYQVISEREEREEVTKGRQEGRGGGECRGRTTACMGHGDRRNEGRQILKEGWQEGR
tara:strand:+ start:356 stop:634 length:279 start_codon:yes stop_codon:yes gene_type:complete